ncbi:hypothetical protein S40285_00616 [Stachybotrys chlorohalonatus IBT 40285]|uniref:Tubulin-specific chaperone A n=1 Tax=Stachybotrys chlorohalonatus (strain IBT 40285) TaxID=1283841 RepID=A0A084R2K9_STAC4|nr:hypothetical protein S40285_00616 [Stachybotrys chlorohalonata IBT 40285]
MPPPSHLAIATSSVRRLLKEEASYRQELVDQQRQIKALEEKTKNGQAGDDEDGNAEFMLKQHQLAAEETKAVFEPLQKRIADAVTKLENQIELRERSGAPEAEMEQAKAALAEAKAAQNGTS